MKNLNTYLSLLIVILFASAWIIVITYQATTPEAKLLRQMVTMSQEIDLKVNKYQLEEGIEKLPKRRVKAGPDGCEIAFFDIDSAMFVVHEGEVYLYDKRPAAYAKYVEWHLPCGLNKFIVYKADNDLHYISDGKNAYFSDELILDTIK